jgi:uncharacterized protein DUF4184
MPFTISHVAAILPFSRALARWRLLSATVIGSMVPDFGWFMPWRPARFETHSVLSLVTFALPVGLATFWIFQRLLKAPLMELLPDAAYSRWRQFAAPADYSSAVQWLLAACGVLAGAVTHLVWDAFTHEGARGVRMLPVLDESMVQLGRHHLMGARLMQDASSLLGLIVLLAVVLYGLRGGEPEASPLDRRLRAGERCAWTGAYVLTALILSGLFFMVRHPALTTSLEAPIGGAAIAVLRGIAVALVGVTAALRFRLHTDPAPGFVRNDT